MLELFRFRPFSFFSASASLQRIDEISLGQVRTAFGWQARGVARE